MKKGNIVMKTGKLKSRYLPQTGMIRFEVPLILIVECPITFNVDKKKRD